MGEDIKPRPCPFCGHTKIRIGRIKGSDAVGELTGYAAQCAACGVCTAGYPSPEDVISAWNTRCQ